MNSFQTTSHPSSSPFPTSDFSPPFDSKDVLYFNGPCLVKLLLNWVELLRFNRGLEFVTTIFPSLFFQHRQDRPYIETWIPKHQTKMCFTDGSPSH